jgi:O-antigen/teichoic acid export membrane protein
VAITPILIHGLGDFYYGMWILAGSLLEYYGLLDMGMRTAMFRYVSQSKGANDRRAMNQIFVSTLAFTLVVGLGVMVLTLLLAGILPGFFKLTGAPRQTFQLLVVLLGFSIAAAFPSRMLGAYLNSLERFDLYNLAAIVSSVLRAVLIVAALRLGHGVLGVAIVALGTSVFSLVFLWGLVRWVDAKLILNWGQASWRRIRELVTYGFFIFIYTAGDYLRFYTDSVVIARMLGTALITPFSVATRLMEYFKLVLGAVGGPLMGRMSELDGQAKHEELRRLFITSTRMTALLSVFLGSLLILDGRPLLRLWIGPEMLSSYVLVLILTAGYVVALAQHSTLVVISSKGRHRPMALWTLAEGAANLVLSIYWARKYGLIGVALGTAAPMLVVNLLIQPWYALRIVDVSPWEYIQKALARPAGVCALFFGICWLASTRGSEINLFQFAYRVGWQTVVFALLAYLLGFGSGERRQLRERGKQLAVAMRLARAS